MALALYAGETQTQKNSLDYVKVQTIHFMITFSLLLYPMSWGKRDYSPKGNFLYRPRFQPTTLAYNLRPPSFLFLFVPFSVSERLGSRHCFRLVFGTFECWAIVVGSV